MVAVGRSYAKKADQKPNKRDTSGSSRRFLRRPAGASSSAAFRVLVLVLVCTCLLWTDLRAAVCPVQDVEVAVPVAPQSRAWCWCMCLGLALMLSGVVIGGVYLYHHYILEVRAQQVYCSGAGQG